ncbi:MAG TPA: hypothetical protein VJB99_04630 [Patescibacteria group bacterium]|nr:hypothetical protein [Patescibacteria group bacterium]
MEEPLRFPLVQRLQAEIERIASLPILTGDEKMEQLLKLLRIANLGITHGREINEEKLWMHEVSLLGQSVALNGKKLVLGKSFDTKTKKEVYLLLPAENTSQKEKSAREPLL